MSENKLDKVFIKLSNSPVLYQELIDAVAAEAMEAKNQLNSRAVRALYHPEEAPQACGQGGVYQNWEDILARLRRIQNTRSGS